MVKELKNKDIIVKWWFQRRTGRILHKSQKAMIHFSLIQRIPITQLATESVFHAIATVKWVIWDLFVPNIKRKDLIV